jgi:excisionase family DNA binding protein
VRAMKGGDPMHDVSRLAWSVSEAAAALGLSKGATYHAVTGGEIPSVKVGGRILVPRAGLEELLRRRRRGVRPSRRAAST